MTADITPTALGRSALLNSTVRTENAITISPAPPSPTSTRAARNSATDVEYAHATDPIPNSAREIQQDLLAAVPVTQQAGREHRRGQHQEVSRREPLQVGLRRVQCLGQRGQGHAEHRSVDTHHQDGQGQSSPAPTIFVFRTPRRVPMRRPRTMVTALLLLAEEASSPNAATDRRRSSCPNQASHGQICQPALPGSGATLPEAAQVAKQSPARLRDCPPCYHSRYSQAIVHFNESRLTSKCLWHSGEKQRAFDQLLVRLAQSR